ncbi:carboxypeptidase-like regulatory domain-containing protein [Pedobacter sp.]|uniref:carboxypeptidase-like regulatory domain-containing protein n=1 Tax=Pedobacter sp. TaxID=1411316 RepID=UPI003D7F79B5
MKYLKIVAALILVALCIHLPAYSQQDTTTLKNIIKKTSKLAELYPVEKVYLHFDKPYYSVVDTMWFKAYLTSDQNLPSQLSKIVYVDVMNSKDSLVSSLKFPVTNSVAYGNIPLDPLAFKQGNYYVKAYTLWMLNFDPDYFYSKNIAIGEAVEKELLTHFSYDTEKSSKDQVIKARIQYKNPDKVAFANKTVNWKVISNYEVVAKGKGTTDQNGFLNVSISAKKNETITNGSLVTDIAVGDKQSLSASFDLKPSVGENDIQFFPEGGEIILGVPTQVAFKAINAKGLGVGVTGTVTDQDGNQITTLTAAHAGMGSFYLNTEANKTYNANITFKDGTKKTFALPKSVASGVSLQVTNTNADMINLKIVASDAYYQQYKDKGLYIVAQNGGVVYYAAQTGLQNQVIAAKIPKEKFPSGIVEITLFSAAGEPVSERLVFILHKDALHLTAKTDLPTYKPRQKVKMTVTAANATAKLEGDFSISVTDEQKVPAEEDAETTIFSSLLLSSDLKGYIEKPNYYFNKTDDKKLADLDMLMLTQGYRRFAYKDILADRYPKVSYLPEQGMNITGTLRDRTGMPVKKAGLRLTVPGRTYSAEALTSPSGIFNFQNLNFPDSSQVVISAKYGANGNNLMIMVDPIPAAAMSPNRNAAEEVQNIDSTLNNYLNNSKKQYSYLRQLKEVVIQGAAIKKVSHSDYSALSSLSMMPDHLIDGSRLGGCNDLLTCLKTMAMGLTFDENNFYISRDYNAGKRIPVQVFVGGMPVDLFSIGSVNMAEIESIEIFLKDELGTVNRMHGTNGVISINMKVVKTQKMSLADLKKLLPQNNIVTINPKGYSKHREFYSPKYTTPNSTAKDLRSTIYWNPRVITDATGSITFEFYNAEGKGNYKAVVEGLDKNGNPGRFVFRYVVK